MKKMKKETIDELNKELSNIENLYKSKCVNWTGETIDTNEFYSEIISNELLRNLKEFDKIPTRTRTSNYCRENHSKIEINLKSNRNEEIFAKQITGLKIGDLGKIIDFQIPLKDSLKDDGLGKIDLISYNEDAKTLYLIELKYDGNKETLLRAILESYTYFKIIDKTKLINDCLCFKTTFINKFSSFDPSKVLVKPAVLVVPDCNAYKELKEMEDIDRPKLKALSLALGMTFFDIEFIAYESIL